MGVRACHCHHHHYHHLLHHHHYHHHLHPPLLRHPLYRSFIKTLLIWLAISIVCLLCWLRYGGILPEILVSVMPFPEEDVEGVAILLSVMSGVVLLYKGFTMTECGNRLIDHAVQWFKAVYIGARLAMRAAAAPTATASTASTAPLQAT